MAPLALMIAAALALLVTGMVARLLSGPLGRTPTREAGAPLDPAAARQVRWRD